MASMLPTPDPDTGMLTLPVYCQACGFAMTLECDPTVPAPAQPQIWNCPSCHATNCLGCPWTLVDTWPGHGPDPAV